MAIFIGRLSQWFKKISICLELIILIVVASSFKSLVTLQSSYVKVAIVIFAIVITV